MSKHISIRVPWHDNGWDGSVCRHPEHNQACRVLKAIAEDKDDVAEYDCAGQPFCAQNGYIPPCLREGGAFMSNKAIDTLPVKHPYNHPEKRKPHERYNHIESTKYRLEPFTFTAKPFAWTLRENANRVVNEKRFNTGYNDFIEVTVGKGSWVSHGTNQKRIFDYFYRDVIPHESMIVAYAKTVPFIETPGRVIIAIGDVFAVGSIIEYEYNRPLQDDDVTAFNWECQITHSIRKSRENGFVFPFDEIQKYLNDHPEQPAEELTVTAPDGYFDEFSYASEHLSHDALILTLNKSITVLRKYQQIGLSCGKGKDWAYCIKWCEEKLKTIWRDRGLYPGLGNVLQAAGLGYGQDIASAIHKKISDDELWDKLPEVLLHLNDYLPEHMNNIDLRNIGKGTFKAQYMLNRDMLKLLSRINLTLDQAKTALDPKKILADIRGRPHYADFLSNIKDIKSKDFLENPYLLYEQTRLFEDKYRFGIGQLDVAMFPDPIIGGESIIEDADDERRIRAIIVSVLETAAHRGSTLVTADDIVLQVNLFRSDVDFQLDISNLVVKAFEDFFSKEFARVDANTSDDESIILYQLNRFMKIGDVIRNFVQSRVNASLNIQDDWAKHLYTLLKKEIETEHEDESRSEKVKAIKIMAGSKTSILTGGAGTGKTSTLAALCLSKEIQENNIIILAPTGKARVVLETKLRENGVPHQAYTIFQFLQKTSHCDWMTYRYYLSGKQNSDVIGSTVIVDECSMLTEEMIGALVEALAGAKRVIFVGDPNQLPPIGAGKPFFEIVEFLKSKYPESYARLNISNRQKSDGKLRLDVELSKMFTYDHVKEADEDIFSRIEKDSENIKFVRFYEQSDLHRILLEAVKDSIGMVNVDDIQKFDESLGGCINGEWMNFNDISKIDSWQILSPYRNDQVSGSATVNRLIYKKYRIESYDNAPKKIGTKYPLGTDGIIFGDKVINIRNQSIQGYPKNNGTDYVANGEIGIVDRVENNSHRLRFSSQPDTMYYWKSTITDNDSDLELAYALTVHKAQGSGFGTTILVINEPMKGANAFISREMIYTALTRQTDKIYIVYNREPAELRKYADAICSDLAHRLTNLFGTPKIRKFNERYFADNLIHITRSGERVRSKSEVIIYNELDMVKIHFKYEKKLKLPNGIPYSPDFTIFKVNGSEIYWEHLGMLTDINYRKKWEQKKINYIESGISEERGNLIITVDEANGAIDSSLIADIVKRLAE